MPIRDFRDLEVWQKAVDLSVVVYKLTRRFPKSELFGITHQMRRSAVSVSSNIAEGNGRHTRKDYAKFLSDANGSKNEVLSLLATSRRLEFATDAEIKPIEHLADRVAQMLMALRSRVLGKRKGRRRVPSPGSRVPAT
jgi:four helix bundle protein